MIVGQSACVSEVRVASAQPFGPNGEPSAIDKGPITGSLNSTDFRHHGGLWLSAVWHQGGSNIRRCG